MFVVHSQRAQSLLNNPPHFRPAPTSRMRKFPSEIFNFSAEVEMEGQTVKNLSFYGDRDQALVVVLESMASLLIGKNISYVGELTLRECEAFLRDRNSQPAFENLSVETENELKRFFIWLRLFPSQVEVREYHFESEKGPFARLSLVDKVRELKAFLHSPEIVSLYEGRELPELTDVEDLTVYLQAPYADEADRILFDRLHELGVETFQDERLNFIPDA